MSNGDNSNGTETLGNKVKAVSGAVGNIVSKVFELKESNPKVFFGGIATLVVVILILMMSGGDSDSKINVVNISIGQTYELRSVNTYDPNSTVRLVSIPGSMAAYDDTESEDRIGGCKHMPQGTKVKALEVQQAFKTSKFVKVEIIAGDCAGQKGWTIINNLK